MVVDTAGGPVGFRWDVGGWLATIFPHADVLEGMSSLQLDVDAVAETASDLLGYPVDAGILGAG